MIVLLLLCSAAASSLARPTKDFFLPLASENLPSIIVPRITGLYETPREFKPSKPFPSVPATSVDIAQPNPVVPHLPTSDQFIAPGLEQIDLRISPSEDNAVITGNELQEPLLYGTKQGAPSEIQTVEIEDNLDEEPIEVDISESLRGLDENINDLNRIIFEREQVPELPIGLYETPQESNIGEIQTEPEIPSGLYDPPTGASNPRESIVKLPLQPQPQNLVPSFQRPATTEVPVAKNSMMGMPYEFQYAVDDEESGTAFQRFETSDGTTTRGEYRVELPDGRTQVVTFFDNGMGFNAQVTYI